VDSSADAIRIADLVNRVYALAEGDLWREDKRRTSAAEVGDWLAAGELLVVAEGDEPLGCVRVRLIEPGVAELGVLAVEPQRQGEGIGRELVDLAERRGVELGASAMRLRVLTPLDNAHAGKRNLDRWYTRRGYRVVERERFDDPLLATPCDFVYYERQLSSTAHV
jgi:ribosomal protein S18 acetylase RimI-like enzyme